MGNSNVLTIYHIIGQANHGEVFWYHKCGNHDIFHIGWQRSKRTLFFVRAKSSFSLGTVLNPGKEKICKEPELKKILLSNNEEDGIIDVHDTRTEKRQIRYFDVFHSIFY